MEHSNQFSTHTHIHTSTRFSSNRTSRNYGNSMCFPHKEYYVDMALLNPYSLFYVCFTLFNSSTMECCCVCRSDWLGNRTWLDKTDSNLSNDMKTKEAKWTGTFIKLKPDFRLFASLHWNCIGMRAINQTKTNRTEPDRTKLKFILYCYFIHYSFWLAFNAHNEHENENVHAVTLN